MVGLQQLILATHRLGVGETKFNICFEIMKSLFLFVYLGVTGLPGLRGGNWQVKKSESTKNTAVGASLLCQWLPARRLCSCSLGPS